MIEAVAILVGVGGCVAVAVSPLSPTSVPDPSSAHADALRRQERQLSALVLSFAAFCCLSLTAIGSGHPRMVLPMLGAMLLAILVVHPWTIVRAILIPLGLPRAAHAVTKLGGEPWVRDPNGGAVLAGALACRRRASVDPYDTRFLVERLADGPLRGAGIVAAALLAEDRSDRATAMRLLASLEILDPDVYPPLARSIALDFAIADAAERGDWDRVVAFGRDALRTSRTSRFLVAVARSLTDDDAGDDHLVWRWLVAPRRRKTLPLLRMARRARARTPTGIVALPRTAAWQHTLRVADPTEVAANGGPLPHARPVATFREAVLFDPRQDEGAGAGAAAASFDATLDDWWFREFLRSRVVELGCAHSPEALARALGAQAAADLSHLWVDGSTRPARRSTGARARACFVERTAAQLAAACRELAERRERGDATLSLWLTCAHIHACFEDAVERAGSSAARAAYVRVEAEVGATAAWLWNERQERGLANALSLWLVTVAERVRDTSAADHHRRNALTAP